MYLLTLIRRTGKVSIFSIAFDFIDIDISDDNLAMSDPSDQPLTQCLDLFVESPTNGVTMILLTMY